MDNYLLQFIIQTLPGLLIGIILTGFLFGYFHTNNKDKEMTTNKLILSLLPGIAVMIFILYFEFVGFPWTNLNSETLFYHLINMEMDKIVLPMFLAGIAYTYSAQKYFQANIRYIAWGHIFVSILSFYTVYTINL